MNEKELLSLLNSDLFDLDETSASEIKNTTVSYES